MTTMKNHNTNLIDRQVFNLLKSLVPEADKQEVYELCKAYVRAKKPSSVEYVLAVDRIAEWLEV